MPMFEQRFAPFTMVHARHSRRTSVHDSGVASSSVNSISISRVLELRLATGAGGPAPSYLSPPTTTAAFAAPNGALFV